MHPYMPYPLLHTLCMVARIGDGPVMMIGASKVWYAGGVYGTGELFLGINDDVVEDNSLAWQAKITTMDATYPGEIEKN